MEFICDSITVTGGMMKYNEIEITVDRENKAIVSPDPYSPTTVAQELESPIVKLSNLD